jgi:hypothetical protein
VASDLGGFIKDLENYLKTVEQDVVTVWEAILNAFKQGKWAPVATALVAGLKDVEKVIGEGVKDVQAAVSEEAQVWHDWVNQKRVVDIQVTNAPIVGDLLAIYWHGTKDELLDALVKGTVKL